MSVHQRLTRVPGVIGGIPLGLAAQRMPELTMPATLLPAAPPSSSAPDASESAMTTLYRASIGPIHAEHYLPRFRHFDTLGRTPPGWNWAASLCTLNWMALRHLWGPALVYVAAAEGLGLLVFGMGRNLLQWSDPVQWGLAAVFALLAFVLPGLYGDGVLHTEIRKRIARALAATRTIPEACAQLEKQSATRNRLMGLVLLNAALLAAALVAYQLLPQGSPAESASAPAPLPDAMVKPPSAPASTSTPAAPLDTASDSPQAAVQPASSAASHAAPVPAALPLAAPAPANTETPSTTPPAPQSPASIAAAPSTARTSTPAPAATRATAPPKAGTLERPPAAPRTSSQSAPAAAATSQPVPGASPRAKTPAPTAAASSTEPAASVAAAASSPEASAATASDPAPVVGSAPGYYINVGLFAEEANARKAQARLLNAGLPAFRQRLESPGGQRFRVRVGPYPGLPQAQAAARSIRALQLEAVVFKQSGTNTHEPGKQ